MSNEITENDLLKELSNEFCLPDIEPDEITVAMLARKIGISDRRTRDILSEKEERGELTKRYVRVKSGCRAMAFRKVLKK